MASTVELATLWGCDRKTAAKVVRMFNEMGILTSQANNRTTVHTIHCLAFWLGKDGDAERTIKNPHYTRCPVIRSAQATGFHTSNHGADTIGSLTHGQLASNPPSPMSSDSDADSHGTGNITPALGNDRTLSDTPSHYFGCSSDGRQATDVETSNSSEHGI